LTFQYTLKFNRVKEVVGIYVRGKCHQAKFSGLCWWTFLLYLAMVKNPNILSCDLDLWPMTLKFNRFVWLSRYTFVQYFIELRLAVHVLSCWQWKKSAEDNTVVGTANRGLTWIKTIKKYNYRRLINVEKIDIFYRVFRCSYDKNAVGYPARVTTRSAGLANCSGSISREASSTNDDRRTSHSAPFWDACTGTDSLLDSSHDPADSYLHGGPKNRTIFERWRLVAERRVIRIRRKFRNVVLKSVELVHRCVQIFSVWFA